MNQENIAPASVAALEEMLSRPTPGVVDAMKRVDGDIVVLGAGGKMGPSLAVMARRASDAAGKRRRITAVSRFGGGSVRDYLEAQGVETLSCDLLATDAMKALPDGENIIYMAGMKFGADAQASLTWAMNALLPGLVCERYRQSRAVVFSTGNIYGLVPVSGRGSQPEDTPSPQGEYAMSALGRERIFEHYARAHGLAQSVIRLNYACDLRYGVLVDIARRVLDGQPVSLDMGFFNTIWQGDANALSLMSLAHAAAPPCILNVTGTRILRVRDVALRFGALFGREPVFTGTESPDALLSDNAGTTMLLGPPVVDEQTLMAWTASWLTGVGVLLNKPTHFESRDGRF